MAGAGGVPLCCLYVPPLSPHDREYAVAVTLFPRELPDLLPPSLPLGGRGALSCCSHTCHTCPPSACTTVRCGSDALKEREILKTL